VNFGPAPADLDVPGYEEHCSRPVEEGVQCREVIQIHNLSATSAPQRRGR